MLVWMSYQDTIAIVAAFPDRSEPVYRGEIANTSKAIKKLVQRLSDQTGGELILFCYEASPCAYVSQRQLTQPGHVCQVVVPSLLPRKPGERVKTDRRDVLKLARGLRAGELTPVWVPDCA